MEIKYKLFDIPVNERDLCFFDTETTGFELDKELLEIGAVRVKANTFEKLSEIDIKIKPQHIENATPEALQVVGYDEKEWEKDGIDGIAAAAPDTDDFDLGKLTGKSFDKSH